MLKRTPGKWKWDFSKAPETYSKRPCYATGIFVEDGDGEPLTSTIGDLELMAHAPKMHEMLYKVQEELSKAISYKGLTTGLYAVAEKITLLLEDINVKRQKEARR